MELAGAFTFQFLYSHLQCCHNRQLTSPYCFMCECFLLLAFLALLRHFGYDDTEGWSEEGGAAHVNMDQGG